MPIERYHNEHHLMIQYQVVIIDIIVRFPDEIRIRTSWIQKNKYYLQYVKDGENSIYYNLAIDSKKWPFETIYLGLSMNSSKK